MNETKEFSASTAIEQPSVKSKENFTDSDYEFKQKIVHDVHKVYFQQKVIRAIYKYMEII